MAEDKKKTHIKKRGGRTRYKKNLNEGLTVLDPNLLTGIKEDVNGLIVPKQLNPHGLITVYMAVCNTCRQNLSPSWRSSKALATADEAPHLKFHHWTDIIYKIV